MKERTPKRSPQDTGGMLSLLPPLATAFVTGTACILVEVIGARALAPYFGSSLMVWTAQITATLLFLALGYEVGGRITRKPSPLHLPLLLFVSASWLAIYPILRSPVLLMSSMTLGVASGSFLSATILFGIPLLAIGAMSPVLVSDIDRSRPGAGSAAGSLFFISTLGGLAGGWIAVFVVIPHLSVRLCIVGTGVVLAGLGVAWALRRRGTQPLALICVAALGGGLVLAVPSASDVLETPTGVRVKVLYSRQSDVGLVRVLDVPALRPKARLLLIDGIWQGAMRLDTGEPVRPLFAFMYDLARLGRLYNPGAKNALVLGLGAGLLPKELSRYGLQVSAVELDPRIVRVARRFFGLPPGINVTIADARTFLRKSKERYDLVYLDTFAGENVPWYLTTVEASAAIKALLAPGGRLVVNVPTNAAGTSAGLARIKSSLLAVFPDLLVWRGAGSGLVNATVIAGSDLRASQSLPEASWGLTKLDDNGNRVAAGSDDWDDIDYADVDLREQWRRQAMAESGPNVVGD